MKKMKIIENSAGIKVELPEIPLNRILTPLEMSRKIQELWRKEMDKKNKGNAVKNN